MSREECSGTACVSHLHRLASLAEGGKRSEACRFPLRERSALPSRHLEPRVTLAGVASEASRWHDGTALRY